MSEPRLILPLLADHLMGDPISSHHGVACCPAIGKETNDKYIVKIISVPASQTQLDALLLTGAYPSKKAALAYFQELTESAAEEAVMLKKLSALEGFTSYEGWQIVPMEDRAGFQLYLLGSYKPTLARHLKKRPLTHLEAVNLGLDLCAALSVCRRCGYLYVDLKPENVFLVGDREYRIGDLGFQRLDALKYASLPDRYRSAYTAPEISDAYSSLNTTLDTYAVGMILYQVFNNSELPLAGEDGLFPPPAYADYEMAEIILKACHPDPEQRWQDPAEMGQALVSYMQRNSVNDVPIIPPVIPEEPVPAEAPSIVEESPLSESPSVELLCEVLPEYEPDQASEADELLLVIDTEISEEAQAPEENELSEVEDETVPTEADGEALPDAAVTDEVSAMLAQADELIAHPLPDPVVAPEPVEIPMPDPILPEAKEDNSVPSEEVADVTPEEAEDAVIFQDVADAEEASAVAVMSPPEEESVLDADAPVKAPKKHTGLIALLITVAILLLLACGAFYYYENYYLQPILGIHLNGSEDQLTVVLDTEIDNTLLCVYCTDTYGNKLTGTLENNTATFTDLKPGSSYKISVEISGFHQLIGTTTASYVTASQTNIIAFTARAGDQDGSVVLHFDVQGPENTTWNVRYSAEGVAEQIQPCTTHNATVTGLEPGKVYTFQLEPVADLYVVGNDTIQFTATKVIYAQELAIHGFQNGALTASWSAPEWATVNSWTVRCYNNDGFKETYTVTEPQIAIEGLDPAQGYTIYVEAEGMSVGRDDSISANSITFKELLLDDSVAGQLTITWNYEGTAPADGWQLFYTIDGGVPYIVPCEQNTCTISPLLPGGHYSIYFDLPDNITVFGGRKEYDVPQAPSFDRNGIAAADFTFRMCHTPADVDWKWYTLRETDFSNTYAVGEKASFVMITNKRPQAVNEEVSTLYVIRDSAGNLVSLTVGRTRTWSYMWSEFRNQYATELDIPTMPQAPGEYSVEIYFGGALVTTQSFTVS